MINLKPGDVVIRIWGDGFMRTEMRVAAVDDDFIYCDAQRNIGEDAWVVLPDDPSEPSWKFDTKYGVETDEEMGWGVGPGLKNLVLSRLDLADLPWEIKTENDVHHFKRRESNDADRKTDT
jgi:hypothetical protein